MKKFKMFLVAMATLVCGLAYGQNITVKGVVTDGSSDEAVPFAAIQLKGTMTGANADADGNYMLSVPANGVLVFSALGYNSEEVAVNGEAVHNVRLFPDAESLDDVVVVAYGTAKKSSFTGSAGTVKSESLQKRTVSNVTKAVEGLVAGVQTTSGSGQPGDGASIQIRGVGSINASSSPLYVVDGVPFDGTLSSLNPNDIESLTVLKDASASALYGSRAANGVIMITTKRGSEGRANVNLKATVGFQSRSLKEYDMVNMNEFTELTWEALRNNYYFNGGASWEGAGQMASEGLGAQLGGEAYNPYKGLDWSEVVDPATGKVVANAKPVWNERWMDELTNKNAMRQEYLVGVSGGNDKTKYAFSFGYLDENGVLITTNFKRYSIRANVDHNVTDWFTLGASVNYAYTNQNSSQYSDTQTGNAWYTAQFMAPIYPVYLKDLTGADVLDENGNRLYDYGNEIGQRPKGARFNAIGDLYDNKYETLRDNTDLRAYAILGGDKDVMGALRGLSLSTNFGSDISNRYITSYYNNLHGDGASVGGEVDKYSTRSFSWTWNQILKYERKFNQFHLLAQAGHESYSYNYRYMYAERQGIYPGIAELAPATKVTGNNSYSQNLRLESYFGRLAADFADKYYIEATWRTDGSSRFNSAYRWGQFWSAGASWRISEEPWMKASWIDNMTLRLSYGELGNDGILDGGGNDNYYAWQSFYDLTYPNAGNPGAIVSSLANPSLSWEKKGTWNAGLEGTFFNRFLNLTVEYYYSKTTDLLLAFPMAASTGFTGYNSNIGSMQNQGIEATVRFNWLNKGDFRASSTIMAYGNRNKVLALTSDDTITNGSRVIKVGMPINTFYMAKFAGINPANGERLYWAYEKDENGEMKPGTEYITNSISKATNSKYYFAAREPKFQGSFGSDFQFGPVDFSFLTTFSVGGNVYDSNYASTMDVTYAGDTWSKHALRRWTKPGDVTDVPRTELGASVIACDRFLIDASYFAIKSVQLGFTLPQKWTKAAGIQALRIFASGDNIAMFNRLNGLNPQYNYGGGTNYSYTPTRSISFGVDINF